MTAASAYLTWGVLPALRRAALRQARYQAAGTQPQTGAPNAVEVELQHLQRREAILLRFNLLLGAIILALTALARAS